MTRLKSKKEVEGGEKLELSKGELRFATPKEVARYRASRLKCKKIADIGCGSGFQAFAFARTCKKVIAVDIDEGKIKEAKAYAKRLKIKNIEFITGDALDDSVVKEVKGAEIVFLDTERPPESSSRKLEELRPDIKEFLNKYSKVTEKICIEVPPHLSNIPFDCEREYISLHGYLNRLDLYFGKLKKHDVSVVALPSGKRIFSKGLKAEEVNNVSGYKFICEINPCVVVSDLIGEALGKGMLLFRHGKKCYAVSNKRHDPSFLTHYKVLVECENDDKKIMAAATKAGAGVIVLHESLDPKEHRSKKYSLEKGLEGDKKIHLFVFGKKCFLCERE